jgi:CheY-like chemotaxis protein
MPNQEEFLTHLSKALNHLYDPYFLSRSLLVSWFGLSNQPDTFSSLQKILIEGIEAQSEEEVSSSLSPEWQAYEPLMYRFVQQMGQEEAARNLNMSVRHFRRKEHAAIQVLGSYLWAHHKIQEIPDSNRESAVEGAQQGYLLNELAWLRNVSLEKPAKLERILHEIGEISKSIAVPWDVLISFPDLSGSIEIPAHETAVKQALLNMINSAIFLARGGQLILSLSTVVGEVEITIRRCWNIEKNNRKSPSWLEDDRITFELIRLCDGKLMINRSEGNYSATIILPLTGQIPILVIDDNVDTLQLLQRYSTGTRYHVHTNRDPSQIFDLVEKIQPKIVLLDVMMPGIDGWQILMQMHQNPLTKDIPVIICTILPQQEVAEALNATGFLQKPIMRQAFLEVLNLLVERRERESR